MGFVVQTGELNERQKLLFLFIRPFLFDIKEIKSIPGIFPVFD